MTDQNLSPTATGTLERTPLAHLLVYCLDRVLTGTLLFDTPADEHAAVFLEAGAIVYLEPPGLPTASIDDDILTLFAFAPPTRYSYFAERNLLAHAASYGPTVPTDPRGILVTGIRDYPQRVPIDRTVSQLGARPLRITSSNVVAPYCRDPIAAPIISMIAQGNHSLQSLTHMGLWPEADVKATLYGLLLGRAIEVSGATRAPAQKPPTQAPTATQSRPPPSLSYLQAESMPPSAPVPQGVGHYTYESGPQSQRQPAAQAMPGYSSQPPQSRPPTSVAPALSNRAKEIIDFAENMNSKTYYELFGVAPTATADEIQKAYFQVAKQWHPDRMPPDLAPVMQQVGSIFARFTEAHQVLSNPTKRAAYDGQLQTGVSASAEEEEVARVLEATASFQKAEVFMKKGDYAAAEQLVTGAVKADPLNPDYDAALAWITANRAGALPQDITVSISVLDDVLRKHPEHQKALWYRGSLLKRIGKDDAAVLDFRKLLHIKPNHLEAEREVRVYEMRNRSKLDTGDEKGALDALKSTFGKFFKR